MKILLHLLKKKESLIANLYTFFSIRIYNP